MELKSVQAISSFFLIFLLAATVSSEYVFNGFRGSFIPNDLHKNENSVTSTSTNTAQQNNNLNNHNHFFNNNNNYNNNNNNNYNKQNENRENPRGSCIQKTMQDFRPLHGACSKFQMCSNGVLITFNCPDGTVYNHQVKSCVPRGSKFDSCTEGETNQPNVFVPGVHPQPISQLSTLCPRGATYKKAHPVHCARYYDCSRPAMMSSWEDHEWECKYPFLFNEDTGRCEHYSMVSCGVRKIAYDQCDYKQYSCNGHAHCRPCTVQHPSCRNLPDGMNVWQGRTPSPYYVVCAEQRVVYSGSCPGGQLFDSKTGTCVINNNNFTW